MTVFVVVVEEGVYTSVHSVFANREDAEQCVREMENMGDFEQRLFDSPRAEVEEHEVR